MGYDFRNADDPKSPGGHFRLQPPLPDEAVQKLAEMEHLVREHWGVDQQLDPLLLTDHELGMHVLNGRQGIEAFAKFVKQKREKSQITILAQEIWLHPPTGPRLYDKEAVVLHLYLLTRHAVWQAMIARPALEAFTLLSDSQSNDPEGLTYTES